MRQWVALSLLVALGFGCDSSDAVTGKSDAGGGGGEHDGGSLDSGSTDKDSAVDSGDQDAATNDKDAGPPGYQCPYTLTALTPPAVGTADISLYFSVADANHEGVVGLNTKDFVSKEDGDLVDKNESDFNVVPLDGQTLDAPTVLLLDTSGSIVKGGAIDDLKASAKAIIAAMVPEQRMAIVSFADTATVRVAFTNDKKMLNKAVDDLGSDGASTNLYGALIQAFGMWQDGFQNDPTYTRLTAGIAIVITDGADTAKVKTLSDVTTARQTRRVVAVGIGDGVNTSALTEIGSAGFIQTKSFTTLKTDIGKVTKQMQTLSKSIYKANYCSPARAGSHQLVFTVACNGDITSEPTTSCQGPLVSGGVTSCDPGSSVCAADDLGSTCCPSDTPYACLGSSNCYATEAEAAADCSSECIHCGGASQPIGGDTGSAGEDIEVTFDASAYNSKQCPAFWGKECNGLKACCSKSLDPAGCINALNTALGDENTCMTQNAYYCPTLGTECKAANTCCSTLSSITASQCRSNVFSAHGNESQCMTTASYYCPTTTNCKALATCCAAKSDTETSPGSGISERSQCEQAMYGAQNYDSTCQSYLTSYSCQ